MLKIEYQDNLDEEVYSLIDSEFNKFAIKNDVICNYKSFAFVAKDNEKVVGIITGHSYYKEVILKRDNERAKDCRMGERCSVLLNKFKSYNFEERYFLDTTNLTIEEIIKKIENDNDFVIKR